MSRASRDILAALFASVILTANSVQAQSLPPLDASANASARPHLKSFDPHAQPLVPQPATQAPGAHAPIPRAKSKTMTNPIAQRAVSASSQPLPAPPPTTPRRTPIIDHQVRRASATESTMSIPSANHHDPSSQVTTVTPMIQVSQSVPAQIVLGPPRIIEITLANRGSTPVEKVIVTDALDPALEVVSSTPPADTSGEVLVWSLGRLEAGDTRKISLTVGLRPGVTAPTAVARAAVSYTSALESSMKLLAARLALQVTGPSQGVAGQPIELNLTVSNQGSAPAARVILKSLLPESLGHPEGPELEYEVGDIPPGQSRQIPLSLIAAKPGPTICQFAVHSEGLASVEAAHTLSIEDYRLAVACEAPTTRYLNQTCAFRVKVVNQGGVPATGARVRLALGDGMTFAHATDGGRQEHSDSVVWDLPELKPSEMKEISVTCVASKIGETQSRVQLEFGQGRTAEALAAVSVKGISALSVEVVDVADPVEVRGETIYEIHVVNQGTLPATNVFVQCEIPEEMEAIAADGPTSQKMQAGVLTYDPLESLEPRKEAIFRVKCRGLRDASARFRASVKTDQVPTPITEEENTTIFGG